MDRKKIIAMVIFIVLQALAGFIGVLIAWKVLDDLMDKAQTQHQPTISALEWFEEEQSPKVNLIIKKADLGQILTFFAKESELDLVFVEPNQPILVSMKFTEVPWRRALRLILEPNGLTYRIEGKTLVVLPQFNSQ